MKPVTPSSITSGTEPRLKAITGVPQAIASIITRPNGSGQSIGTSSAMAPLRKSDFSLSLISPMNSTLAAIDQRLDLARRNSPGRRGRPWRRSSAACRNARRSGSRDRRPFPARCGRGRRDSCGLTGFGIEQVARAAHDAPCAPSSPAAAAAAAHSEIDTSGTASKVVEHRLMLGQIEPAVQRGQERRRLAARTARTDSSRDGNAARRTRSRADRRAPASSCAARWDRAPRRRAAAPAATPPRAWPRCANRRWRTASRRGRARPVPRSARTRRVRFHHKAWAESPRSTERFARYASILTFHGPGMDFPSAPRCPDANTTTNHGRNISIPAWNLFFANRGTFSRLHGRSECAKLAVDGHWRDDVPTQNGQGSSARRVTKLFCAADVAFSGSRRCDPWEGRHHSRAEFRHAWPIFAITPPVPSPSYFTMSGCLSLPRHSMRLSRLRRRRGWGWRLRRSPRATLRSTFVVDGLVEPRQAHLLGRRSLSPRLRCSCATPLEVGCSDFVECPLLETGGLALVL